MPIWGYFYSRTNTGTMSVPSCRLTTSYPFPENVTMNKNKSSYVFLAVFFPLQFSKWNQRRDPDQLCSALASEQKKCLEGEAG